MELEQIWNKAVANVAPQTSLPHYRMYEDFIKYYTDSIGCVFIYKYRDNDRMKLYVVLIPSAMHNKMKVYYLNIVAKFELVEGEDIQ